jgi:hypothetical protein
MTRRQVFAPVCFLALGVGLGAAGVLLWQHLRRPARSLAATVYLPRNDNQGKRFPRKTWRGAVRVFVERFGGATLGGRREGYWLNSHRRVQREPIQLLTVSFEPGRLEEFRDVVRQVGRRLGQETVYVRIEERHIELITVPAGGPKKGR